MAPQKTTNKTIASLFGQYNKIEKLHIGNTKVNLLKLDPKTIAKMQSLKYIYAGSSFAHDAVKGHTCYTSEEEQTIKGLFPKAIIDYTICDLFLA